MDSFDENPQDPTARQLGLASIILAVVGWVVMCGCAMLGLSFFAYGVWLLGLILAIVAFSMKPSAPLRPMVYIGLGANLLSIVVPCCLGFIAALLYVFAIVVAVMLG